MIARFTAWVLGIDRVVSIDRLRPALGAEWATEGSGPFWFCLALATIVGAVILFYMRYQHSGSRCACAILAAVRSLLLLLLFVTLAEPVVRITVSRYRLPALFVVFDATASMNMHDHYDSLQQCALTGATGVRDDEHDPTTGPSRQDYVRGWLTRSAKEGPQRNLLARLAAQQNCLLRFYSFAGQTESSLRELVTSEDSDTSVSWQRMANQLESNGQVTALGSVLRSLRRQPDYRQLAGVVLISDFAQNSGEHPLSNVGNGAKSPLTELSVPIYTIGVGAARNRDLAVTLQTEPKIRRGERTNVAVCLQQSELSGQTASVRLFARPLSHDRSTSPGDLIGQRDVTLHEQHQVVEFPYLPTQPGEMELSVQVSELPGEASVDNNSNTGRIQIIDDFIRLLYVAYQPTWEWRFAKEVFHRDPAVGMRGFRTYLASSDPRVRESNPLFLPTLSQNRADFFANDVLLLDDMPRSALTAPFCTMTERFVARAGWRPDRHCRPPLRTS